MPRRNWKTDPPGERRVPQYASVVAACAVGCFECGARLVQSRVQTTTRATGAGGYTVICAACGAVKDFDVVPPPWPKANDGGTP
jgi:hypothetical protein